MRLGNYIKMVRSTLEETRFSSEDEHNFPDPRFLELLTLLSRNEEFNKLSENCSVDCSSSAIISLFIFHKKSSPLRGLIRSLEINGKNLSNRLSPDTRNLIFNIAQIASDQTKLPFSPEESLNTLYYHSRALQGILEEGHLHDLGWTFLQIGVRLETSVFILETIRFMYENADHLSATFFEGLHHLLELILSYRRVYGHNVSSEKTLEMLIYDKHYPHSLASQTEELKKHISSLPDSNEKVYSQLQRLILVIESSLHSISFTNLNDDKSGIAWANSLLFHFASLNDILTEQYLARAEVRHSLEL